MSGMKDLFGDSSYPNQPGFKAFGTSQQAASAAARYAGNLRELALAVIIEAGVQGRTADEVADKLNKSVLAVRPRVAELAAQARIIKTGVRRLNRSGLPANVWIVTPAPAAR